MTDVLRRAVEPVCPAEHAHSEAGRMPDAARVADGVWVVPLAIAPGHMPYTLSYLVADDVDGIHLIDAGWDLDGNLDAVASAVARFGEGRRLASVVVTHLHPDHLGLASRLRDAHGVPVVLHRREARAQAAVVARAADDRPLRDELVAWGVREERRDGIVRGYPRAAYVRIDADVLVDHGDPCRSRGGGFASAMGVADRIVSGVVHINEQTVGDETMAPFGGMGASGNGARFGGPLANYEAFTETQWVTVTPEIERYELRP